MTDQTSSLRWIVAITVSTGFVIWLNPMGFMGGRWDDWQYLNAARCWVDFGPCVPKDHWQGRWPIIAPLALVIELFGESRWSISLPTLAASIASIGLIAWIGNRLFGKPVGYVTALLWTAVPTFMVQALQPNISHIEFALLLASLACILLYAEKRKWALALGAGLFLGLAFQARETVVLAVPVFAIIGWIVARRDWKALTAAAVGAIAPLLAEFVIYWGWVGDPTYRRFLSVEHARVFSPELLGPVDPDRPPFFNEQYIANWNHKPGIRVHWLIDGPLNLVVNAHAGVTIFLSFLLLPTAWKWMQPGWRKLIKILAATAIYWIVGLTYGFAIDPKPRMMLIPIVISAIIVAAALLTLWKNQKRGLVIAASFMIATSGTVIMAGHQRIWASEATVEQWIDRWGPSIEIDENSRRHLTLVDGVSALANAGSGKPFVLVKSDMKCDKWARLFFPNRLLGPVRRTELSPFDEMLGGKAAGICLFRAVGRVSEDEIAQAKLDAHAPADPLRFLKLLQKEDEPLSTKSHRR